MKKITWILGVSTLVLMLGCKKDDDSSNGNNDDDPNLTEDCVSDQALDQSRGECSETLTFIPAFSETVSGNNRVITTNAIPDHKVGLFGNRMGSLNPNAISSQSEKYTITKNPIKASSLTPLLGATGPDYSFGILFSGVEVDPIAAEPFPHNGIMDPDVNWEWNLEATNVNIGLDCNNAHVQPTGKYHYHGVPTLYIDALDVPSDKMTMIGYAADGFPIYYKYAYSDANDNNSKIIAMTSSYKLKEGNRPGDGNTAPCGEYNGVYSNDYEYNVNNGTLDEANGRTGVTPEYPSGTYYYVITDEFPSIPRYFVGAPSSDFTIGQ